MINKKLFAASFLRNAVVASMIFMTTETTVNAGLNEALNGMMSNATAAQSFQTLTSQGYSFGGVSLRTPIQNINLIAFDPPRMSGGCGGIDLYGGSFSFISGQQLVTLLRSIVQQAASALFWAGIQAISPDIANVMSKFQKMVQDMNSMLSNTCAVAHQLVSGSFNTEDAGTLASDGSALVDAASGAASDMFSGFGLGSSASQAANINSAIQYDPSTGNLTWKALMGSNTSQTLGDPASIFGANNQLLDNEVMMTIMGTAIVTGNPSVSGDLGTQNNPINSTGPSNTAASWPGLITVDDIVNGDPSAVTTPGATPATPVYLYVCTDVNGNVLSSLPGANECLNVARGTTPWGFMGTLKYTNNMIFGVGGSSASPLADGILSKLTNCNTGTVGSGPTCNMSAQQTTFLSLIDAPVFDLIEHGQRNGATLSSVMGRLSPVIGREVAVKLAQSVRKIAAGIWSADVTSHVNEPKGVKDALDRWDRDLTNLEAQVVEDNTTITDVTSFIDSATKRIPGALGNLVP